MSSKIRKQYNELSEQHDYDTLVGSAHHKSHPHYKELKRYYKSVTVQIIHGKQGKWPTINSYKLMRNKEVL